MRDFWKLKEERAIVKSSKPPVANKKMEVLG